MACQVGERDMVSDVKASLYERIQKHINPDELAALTLEFVKIPSPTRQELQMSKHYARTLEQLGLEVELDYVEESRPNVIAKLPGDGTGPNLVFVGHLDTIPIGDCVPPRIDQGRIYGRGSCDMKGSLAAIVCAIRSIVRSGIKLGGDVFVVGHVGHESPEGDGEGVKAIAKRVREGKLKAGAAINMEGPMDSIKVAQGGSSMITILVTSKKGTQYSATSSFSSNPILWTADVIEELDRIDRKLSKRKRHPLISKRPTVQIGLIDGGESLFTVPNLVRLQGVIRWDPDQDFAEVSKEFRATCQKLQRRMRERHGSSVELSVEMRLDREACVVPGDERIVRIARGALEKVTGKRSRLTGTRWVSDLGILYRDGGVPALEYGPFLPEELSLAHTDRESIGVSNLETISKVYAVTMLDFCGGASA